MNEFIPKYSVYGLNEQTFGEAALDIFAHQALAVPVYREYLSRLGIRPEKISHWSDIPFLPVEFFRARQVGPEKEGQATVFYSSSTTGRGASSHRVYDINAYDKGSTYTFERLYGPLNTWCILALLPSYLERGNSSLVHMVQHFMKVSGHPLNGFYLQNHAELHETLKKNESAGQKTLLLGVSYALLDFAEAYPLPLRHTIVMETGGMKGRKKEITRQELHTLLKKAFSLDNIHSEYGMTELLSQAYAEREGLFRPAPWMKVMIRDAQDPFFYPGHEHTGGINVIDLLNLDSCCFIATSDLGKTHADGSFEVLGRFDFSDTRGCSLMSL